jgi:hypothetical protein
MDKLPHGIGFVIGVMLFALFYSLICLEIFYQYGAVSQSSGMLGIVLTIAFGMIGGAIENKIRNRTNT